MMSGTYQRRFFILTPSFHGATLLAKLLNSHPLVTALGDTYPDNRLDQVCGCGSTVSRCPFWNRVKQSLKAERYLDQPKMLPYYPKLLGGKIDHLLYYLLPDHTLKRFTAKDRRIAFCEDYDNFLHAIHRLQPGSPKVFVDGVKIIARVSVLEDLGCPVDGIIHLTREPGDFAKSFFNNTGRNARSLAKGALWWNVYHRLAARLARRFPYHRLSYEDLAENPDPTLAGLFEFVGVPVMNLAELRDHFSEVWHFMGNSSLLGFDGQIRRSRHDLTGPEKILVKLLAGQGPNPARDAG